MQILQLHFPRAIRHSRSFALAVALAVGVIIPPVVAQPQPPAAATESFWTQLERLPDDRPAATEWIRAPKHKAVSLDTVKLRKLLDGAPSETAYAAGRSPAQISLPMPDGTTARFRFVESPVMAPELAAKFPEIRSYVGQGIDDPNATLRFDLTPAGFHAQVLSPRGAVYIDPAFRGDTRLHTSYFKRDYRRPADEFRCLVEENLAGRGTSGNSGANTIRPLDLARSGGNLRTYRVAVAATAEYTTFHGGTVAAGLAAIVTAINRVTGVYESELAIRLVLVANNNLIVYTNASTDPYANGTPSSLLTQNQANLDAVIGSANYDIGHVFSTAGGGLAGLGVVCVSGQKARGETGTSAPTGDAFYIDYVAHEMGHQFGANHTFNSSASNCGSGNRNASTAYEQGSGSTIMAYAGICGSDNLQPHSDPYFHSISFDEILNYSTGGSGNNCAVITATGNTAPTVSAGLNYTIPQNTPFTLTAIGSDPDGDPLTFCWEERDLGVTTTVSAADNGGSPIFRSWNPTTSLARTFPRLPDLLNNTLAVGEVMPTTTRTLNFRVTARDHRAGGGGVNTSDMQVSVTAAAGPFAVTSHNNGGTFSGVQTVTWNVAGTTNPPVSAAAVNILLSTNGGLDFPITLAANTPNDGAEVVVFPNLTTATARLKVEAAGNIFFDICNADFAITSGLPTPAVSLDAVALTAENCASTNQAIDPGETVTLDFALKNIGSGDTTNLVATLLVTNGVTFPSGPQNFEALIAGGAAVNRAYSLTATGNCGGTLTAVLQLQDGAMNLGTVSRTFRLGAVTAITTSFTNSASIAIPGSGTKGPAAPFPSDISVSGLSGTVSKVTVTLTGFTHTWPADVDALLVGPTGQTLLLLSDAGAGNPASGLTLTFDDAAATTLSDTAAFSSGTFKPTDYPPSDSFSPPAPGGPYGATLAVFNGLDPNGVWSLYVQDDGSQDIGSIAQGWQISLTTSNATCCVSNPLASDLTLHQVVTPSALNVGGNFTFILSVTNLGPDTADGVVVTDVLPVGVSFISADPTQGTCTNNGGVLLCALGSLTNAGFATITVQAAAIGAGAGSNLATLSSGTFDPLSTNNAAIAGFSVNAIPTLTHLTNLTTNEDTVVGPLSFTINDVETPPAALTLAVSSSDTNLVPAAGLLLGGSGSERSVTITPAANQTGTTLITLFVSDGQATNSDSFTLAFHAVNHPPVLAAIPDHKIHAGMSLLITNVATDPDIPTNALAFTLDAGAPTGAVIDGVTGIFAWTPADADANSDQSITIRVSDDGLPPLTDAKTFRVTVVSRPVITGIEVNTNFVSVTWSALAGQMYRLQFKTNQEEVNWSELLPEVVATGLSATQTNAYIPEAAQFYRVRIVP